MFSSILEQGIKAVTDPARLHAELWGDYVSKVITCWLPLLLSTLVVGRDLLGSSTQCFPLDLVNGTVQPENGTSVSNGTTSSNPFSDISVYSRQLSEFANVYCAGKDSVFGNTHFSYQRFAMMLVLQAGLMYTPFLIWSITIGRDIICNIRFIAYDTEVVYDRLRKQDTQNQTGVVYGQEELVAAEKKWYACCTMYKWYAAKQAMSVLFSAVFIGVFQSWPPISIHSIVDKFLCSVEQKFLVTCTVPAASVHEFVWIVNMCLLVGNVLVILVFIGVLYKHSKDQPFEDIGLEPRPPPDQPLGKIGKKNESPKETQGQSSKIEIENDAEREPLKKVSEENGQKNDAPKEQPKVCLIMRYCPHFNDSCLMRAFFKANIESVEKYNYVKSLLEVAPRNQDSSKSK